VRVSLKVSCFIITIYIVCFSIVPPAYAGWSENIRLTYRGNEINPQIIARNDTVHVAWNQSGNGNVSYIRSTDGGATWDSLVNLNASGHWGNNAKLNFAENGLLVSWFDYNDDENISSIAISKSINGANWTTPTYVWTDNPNRFGLPVSVVKGDSIILAYFSSRDDSTGQSPFRSMHSYNYGQTWSDEITVGHPYRLLPQPFLLNYCGGACLLVWAGAADSIRGDEDHVYGYRSSDAGLNWSDTIWISPNIHYWAQLVCVDCNWINNKFAVSWMDYRYQIYAFHGDIFTSVSIDGGISWPNEFQSTNNHTAWFPQLEYLGDTLISIWSDMRYYSEGWHEIVLNRSNNEGRSWAGEERITNTEDDSYYPWVSLNNGNLYVIWMEAIPGTAYEIFFKKLTPDSTDAVDESDIQNPLEFALTAYPNPFNSNLTLLVESQTGGFLSIYDIQGRIIRQFSFEKGDQRIVWDATNEDNQPVTSGTYFIGRKGDDSSTIKVIYLK
jgi:hypothetical protein